MDQTSIDQASIRAHSGRSRGLTNRACLVVAAAAILLGVAACGSSSPKAKTSGSTIAPAPTTTANGSTTGFTVKVATVPGVGPVLVNGAGDTLYILSSEKGGKITCTDANGCTKAWPDSELPDGVTSATAGAGVTGSMLGTAKGSDGDLYVTYATYPLYTFSGDGGPGKANGEGISTFGGTWYVMSAAGTPVMSAGGSGSSTPTTAYNYGG